MKLERSERILEIVNQKKKVEVSDLAKLLMVSKVTIRKDLKNLEAQGLLKREHGFAIINNPDNLNYRLAQNYPEKLRIAKMAASLVKDQDTIMIESGATCALLAEELGKQGKKITIITVSYFITNHVAKYSNLSLIVLGGQYQVSSQVVVGPLVKTSLRGFHVEKLFVGTDGFDPQIGFFGDNLMRTETVRNMAQQAQQIIILTDSEKFKKPSLIQQFSFDEVDQVITDNQITSYAQKVLKNNQVKLSIV